MTFSEVTGMLQQYFIVACFSLILLIAVFCIGYFVIYKRLMKGKRKLTIGKTIILFMLVGYILVVLYATFFSRGEYYASSTNFHFFSSYMEAWNSFSLRSWQLLIFNIVFFIPLGALLPLASRQFEKALWTIGAGFLSTLFIESIQLFFGMGIFEFDDIINNLIGIIIGYCIIMFILTLAGNDRNKTRKVICYVLPILLIVGGFTGIFVKYEIKEFGNLALAYNYKINCKRVNIQIDTVLSDKTEKAMVYSTLVYDKDSALQYAKQIYDGFGISDNEIDITQYNDNAIYRTADKELYSLWIQYLGGTYSYTDYSLFNAGPSDTKITETEARELLQSMNIYIPEDAEYITDDGEGIFAFNLDFVKIGDYFCTGGVSCNVSEGNKIKSISNNLILLKEYKSVEIKSESEALEEMRQGKFRIFMEGEEIDTMVISDVELDYVMDSKGYYQPLYNFNVTINGKENTISIPAMK